MYTKRNFYLAIILLLGISLPLMPYAIMLDPAGHTQQTGRRLWGSFERAETFKCAETLKDSLEKYSSSTRVILTRAPGQVLVPLQNASFANRLNVDFFVRIHCVKADTEKPHITVYYQEIDPLIDNAQHAEMPHAFIPLHHAHFRSIHRSSDSAKALKKFLSSAEHQKDFDCYGTTHGLPLAALMGITVPAIVIEIGLCSDDQWKLFIEPLTQGLSSTLNLTNGQS
ncbi:MAG: N-acetylmuramoyl-L-alanine amidase [Candidatus Babeliales bacterium]|jgi:N-acetylmuramoyl-L-alanine amidase